MDKVKLVVSLISPFVLFQGLGDLFMGRVRNTIISMAAWLVPGALLFFWFWTTSGGGLGGFDTMLAVRIILLWLIVLAYFLIWAINNFRYLKEAVRAKNFHEVGHNTKTWILMVVSLIPLVVAASSFFVAVYLGQFILLFVIPPVATIALYFVMSYLVSLVTGV